MLTVTVFNIIVVLFTYIGRKKRYGLLLPFFLIFLFLALRYDYGNDYHNYLDSFYKFNQYPLKDYLGTRAPYDMEIGWIFLCHIFEPLGFFVMTAVLSLFNCFVYYRFIKLYVPSAYYWIAVFLYVFSPSMMLIQSSSMRQTIACNIFIFSIGYIINKDIIRYVICISLASLFHISALILFPIYLIGLFNLRVNKLIGATIIIISIYLFVFVESFMPYLYLIISTHFPKYALNLKKVLPGMSSGVGIAYNSFLFILILHYEKLQSKQIAILFKIAMIYFLIIPFSIIIALFGRVMEYFQPAAIAVLPFIFINIKNPVLKILLLTSVIFATIAYFYTFFNSPNWAIDFGTYKTIFSSPIFY